MSALELPDAVRLRSARASAERPGRAFGGHLPALDLRPAVLKTLLQQPPTRHPQYILHREEHSTA